MRAFGGFLAVLTLLAIAYAYKVSGVLSLDMNEPVDLGLKSVSYTIANDTLNNAGMNILNTSVDSTKSGVWPH